MALSLGACARETRLICTMRHGTLMDPCYMASGGITEAQDLAYAWWQGMGRCSALGMVPRRTETDDQPCRICRCVMRGVNT